MRLRKYYCLLLAVFVGSICLSFKSPEKEIPPSAYLNSRSILQLEKVSRGLKPNGHELANIFLKHLADNGPVDIQKFDSTVSTTFSKESSVVKDLMKGKVSLLNGYGVQFIGTPVQWFLAPKSDLQWTTHLSRHYWLNPLAHAWRATKDSVYSQKIVDVLIDWIGKNPIGSDKLNWGKDPAENTGSPDHVREGFFFTYVDGPWTSLSAHARLDNWSYLLSMIHDSPQMTNRNLSIIFNSLANDHQVSMISHPRKMNQFIAIAASLVNYSGYYPFLKGASDQTYNTEPGNYNWSDNGKIAKAEGVYNFGYGREGNIKVTHKRQITYHREADKFIIEDRFEGDGVHQVELLWQLPPEAKLALKGKALTIENGKAAAQFNITGNKPFSIASSKGSKNPLSGWFSLNYGVLEPSNTVRVTAEGKLPIVFETEIAIN